MSKDAKTDKYDIPQLLEYEGPSLWQKDPHS